MRYVLIALVYLTNENCNLFIKELLSTYIIEYVIQIIPLNNKEIFMPCLKIIGNIVYHLEKDDVDKLLNKQLIEFLKFGLDK